ncbi:MAG: rhomboid family intramembrane serine protease [Oligoflexus sp.]
MKRVDDDGATRPQPILPYVPQPRGVRFFLGTWSGRLILVNAVIFLLLSLESGSFFMPSEAALTKWGAKDNVLIANGEYWRFFTPVFVHIGLIHFAFNNWALYILGYQLEFLLKPKWYIVLYVLAGIGGNIASAVFSLGLSAGASGALFGILGAGFYLERTVGNKLAEIGGKRPRASIYTGMVIANIALGLMIPQIDNAAHMGGLAVGVVFTYALLHMRPNRLISIDHTKGRLALGLLTCLFLLGLGLSCSSQYVRQRYETAVMEVEEPLQVYYLTQILRLDPNDTRARLNRLKLFLMYREFRAAESDLETLLNLGLDRQILLDLAADLESLEKGVAGAVWLRQQVYEAEKKGYTPTVP